MVVIAAMSITVEYRRGLIRTTLAASPRRGRLLAAKAVVIGAVTFILGSAAVAIAVIAGSNIAHDSGMYVLPVSWLTQARVILGTGAMLALASALALSIGTMLRRSVVTVAAVILAIVLPYILGVSGVLPGQRGRVGAAGDAGGRVRHRADRAAVPAGRRPLRAARLLPAGAVGGPRGAVPLRRGRLRSGGVAASAEGRVMTGALRSEWTKLRTDNGTAWILAAICILIVAVGAATAAVTRCGGGAGCAVDPTRVSLTGIEVGQAAVAVLAVLVICGEYSTGMIRVTLTATPRRWMVLAAKAAVLTGLVLAVAVVAVAILNTTGLRNLVISPWAGLGVLAAWAAGALILGGLVLRFRDA
jgi:hypothetical protein